MYVRNAKNRDEAWLLDQFDELDVADEAFRSRDYVLAVDEDSGARAGFGRIRVHSGDQEDAAEVTAVGVPERWRGQGVGAHVIERLVAEASDQDHETVYAFAEEPSYCLQFGFEAANRSDLPQPIRSRLEGIDDERDVVPLRLDVDAFEMPERLRERFKDASPTADEPAAEPEELAEEFGIDSASYKYDTGR